MIQAEDFLEAARARGFGLYAGVPCSFLAPFINGVIDDDRVRYVSSANEGDAVATAAGAVIGGERACAMMQNSGLGNAVSPLTSLTHVFRIPVLVICTHRGAPGAADEPQHALMGEITGTLLDAMRMAWEVFPSEPVQIASALDRGLDFMRREGRPYAFVMEKGAVAARALQRGALGVRGSRGARHRSLPGARAARPSRAEALVRILRWTAEANTVVIATTGYTGRELYALDDRPNHLYMVGSMGCASSLALGLALVRPDLRVVVVDGDGAALMRMGNFATVGAYAGQNLYHIVLDNEAHDSTGAQGTVTASVDFSAIAHACGYGLALGGDRLDLVDGLFCAAPSPGARLLHLKIRSGAMDALPRPKVTPVEVVRRLMHHIGSSPGGG